jgi:hypothetical protein
MTISSTQTRISYNGNGVTTEFAFPYLFLAATDLELRLVASTGAVTLLTLNTDYTVTGVGDDNGGEVTLNVAPAAGERLVINRVMNLVQEIDYITGDPFPAQTHERGLDRLTMMVQQHEERLDRTLQLPITSEANAALIDPSAVEVVAGIAGDVTTVALNDANVTTVAGIDANVTTVAGIAGNVTTVAGIAANVTTVAGNNANVTTVATNIANVNATGSNIANVNAVAGNATNINAVVANETNIDTVAGSIANVNAVGTNIAAVIAVDANETNINAVNSNATNINTVAGIAANVTTVAGISANVTTVAGVSADVTAVAGNATNINTVAGNNSNITTVAGISGNVTTVAGVSADVTAVAGNTTNINAVAANATNINTVAGISADVTAVGAVASDIPTVAANVADITNFSDVYQGPKAADPATRNDSSALQTGDLYFNTVADEMRVYTGTAWKATGSAVNGTTNRQTFTATAAQTTFTITGGYDAGFIDVYLNGVKLVNGVDVAVTSGTAVVLTVGAAAGDVVDVIAYGAFVLANHYTIAQADAQFLAQDDPRVAAIGQFSWDNNATTTSVAKPQVTPSSTLLSSIHGRMRGCLLLNNGQVNYYLNPTNWAQKEDGSASVLTGADGMVMVEIPKFYVKNESSGTLWKPVISATPLPGYDVHPAFIKDGVEVPYRYYSAYDACVFRPSTSTYFSGTNLESNSDNVNTASDQLASVSGIYPMVGLTRNEFRLLAANRGTGWRVGDFTLWSAIGILMAVEAQTLDGQAVYGAGNTGNSYLASSSNQNDSPHTIAGAGNALGNGSTDITSGASNTNRPGTSYMKYRGIENFWGNCWNWTDGINIFSEGNTAGNKVFAYWSNNRTNFADDTATNYGLLGEIANTLNNNRYGTQFSQETVWALVTKDFSTTSTHGTSDLYRTNSGWRVFRLGSDAEFGSFAGAFAFTGFSGSSSRGRSIGARLAY